jgi:hypothetical protein
VTMTPIYDVGGAIEVEQFSPASSVSCGEVSEEPNYSAQR